MNVAFVVTWCLHDRNFYKNSVESVARCYPNAEIVTVADSPRLKLGEFGGQWTKRWMERVLETEADTIIKFDPDTRAQVAAANFPDFDIFGQESQDDTYFAGSKGILLGCAIGFKRSAVKAILDSGKLLDPKYTEAPYAFTEYRFGTHYIGSLQDPIVHDIALQLGLKEGVWSGLDLKMSWHADKNVHPSTALFIHPVRS
jgi:hypothetical protein